MAASVNLLRAIRWASQAWDIVQPITISKCFRRAGVLTASMDVCTPAKDEKSDPFEDLDGESEIQQLIERTMNTVECCTNNKYVSGDDCLAVCVDLDDDKWEDNFMADLAGKHNEVEGEDNGDKDESD